MMSSRLGEPWAVDDVDRGCALTTAVAENLPSAHRYVMPDATNWQIPRSEAFGGVPGLAQQAGLNATTLYRTLSGNGNPELRTLRALLDAMGLRLSIAPAS